ncbi:Phage antitermination protein [Candidatus Regiella insecticola 5.15]|uniref:Phage antitermination protein n=1 Tax=Candidatus Regiella insecticola 5.15 TaxID=1005043 RepID=G2GXV9_9ENTR|nr:antiterminator Q family protein [Candidatus Regiella insecticola]EGY29422.1 Phage antitermination protein [Candidatus Regiella insecticola 5.15]
MNVAQCRLNHEQYHWINHWLERWGAWVHSGRLDKPQSNLLAYFIATVTPQAHHTRPLCNDDDGLLISRVVDTVLAADNPAFGILLSYYVQRLSRYSIAVYRQKTALPRNISTRGGNRLKTPSLATCRREVDQILEKSLYLLHPALEQAFNHRQPAAKVKKVA